MATKTFTLAVEAEALPRFGDGDEATLTFHLSVAGAFAFDQTVTAQEYLTGIRVSLTLPQASGGEGQVTYALSPALPAGLTFDAATRGLAGTPTEARVVTTYTLTATDVKGDARNLTFDIRVVQDATPAFGEPPSLQAFRVTRWDSVALPPATGGNGDLEYLLAPALPAGLTYTAPADATTGGSIFGTPTEGLDETAYTLMATDSDENNTLDDAATLRFTLAVADSVPSFGAETIAAQHYTQDEAVDVTLPEATGGEAALTYAISPALPAGLTFDAATRVLSGTPTEAADEVPYTLTVTDGEGTESVDDDDTATLLFSLAVAAFEAPQVTILITAEGAATNTAEGGEAVFTVSVPAGSEPSADLTVSWTVEADGRGEIDEEDPCYFGDAGSSSHAEVYDFGSEQSNYSYPTGTATIAANTVTATVRIPIFQDLDGEGVETYEVTLSDPQPGNGARATYLKRARSPRRWRRPRSIFA